MCKHEWDRFSKATRCIWCGKYLNEDGKVTTDAPGFINCKKKNGEWVNGQKKRGG
jgi:hypothetical protein